MTERNSALRKVESEIPEQDVSVGKLVEILMESFLESHSDYGIITDIKTDVDRICSLVRDYAEKEKLDIYAIELEDRILLSKTNLGFEEICEVIKEHSELQVRKNMIEIWDDAKNKILHLVIVPLRKHFPIEYSTEEEKTKMINEISSMTQ